MACINMPQRFRIELESSRPVCYVMVTYLVNRRSETVKFHESFLKCDM